MPSRCWFDRRAHDELIAEARRWRLRETGGALLGWREGDQTVVARVLGPGPEAKHRRTSFEPDATWQYAQGRKIYEESGRTVAFLGDWHTHPFGAPRPSRQDQRTAVMLATDSRFRTPIPLYAILGRSSGLRCSDRSCELVVYEVRAGELVPVDVELVDLETRYSDGLQFSRRRCGLGRLAGRSPGLDRLRNIRSLAR